MVLAANLSSFFEKFLAASKSSTHKNSYLAPLISTISQSQHHFMRKARMVFLPYIKQMLVLTIQTSNMPRLLRGFTSFLEYNGK